VNINEKLTIALQSQIEIIEKQMDENLEDMARLQSRLEWHKELNKTYLERIKKISNQIKNL
jgi:L-ribulose-5-phosphate 3-epimerase UlaE